MENVLKRVPPWAYVASTGVVGGVIAYRFISKRGDSESLREDGDATAVGDYGLEAGAPGGFQGVIVPPVQVGGQQDDYLASGYQNLQDLFVGGTQGLLDTLTGVLEILPRTLQNSTQQGGDLVLQGVETGGQLVLGATQGMTGGGPPAAVGPAATPPASAPPPPAPAAPRCQGAFPLGNPPDCYQHAWNYATRTSGKNKWCVKMPRHIYQNGRDVTLSDQAQKVKDGPC